MDPCARPRLRRPAAPPFFLKKSGPISKFDVLFTEERGAGFFKKYNRVPSMSMSMSVSVSGSIAAGKTSLCNRLGEITGMPVVRESVDDNPFLEDFYADRQRWGFALQIYFLSHRLRSYTEQGGSRAREGVIQDRTIFEDSVFPRVLEADGQMEGREFVVYNSIFEDITSRMEIPSVVVFLNVSPKTCLERIRKRRAKLALAPLFFPNARAFQGTRVRGGKRDAGLPQQVGRRVCALRRPDGGENAGHQNRLGEVWRGAEAVEARVRRACQRRRTPTRGRSGPHFVVKRTCACPKEINALVYF